MSDRLKLKLLPRTTLKGKLGGRSLLKGKISTHFPANVIGDFPITVTNTGGDYTIAFAGAPGTGDITTSGASTDNAIVRWNGVTGYIIQNSGCIIDDSNNVLLPGILSLGTPGAVAGQMVLASSSGAFLTTIKAGVAVADRTYVWPLDFGAAGSVLTDASGNGTLSWTPAVSAGSISNAMLANVPSPSFKGRITGGLGSPEDLTGTQATTLLDTFTTALKGLVPAPLALSNRYLRDDGVWQPVPTTVDGNYGDITVSGGSTAMTVNADAITYAKMQNISAASRLLGRGSLGGAGDPEEITLGTGLLMTGTVLSSTGGSAYTDEEAQDAVGTILVDSATIDFTYSDATPSITASVIAVPVANEAGDPSCFVAFFTDATGNLAPKTNAGLTFNSSTATFNATAVTSGGNAVLTTASGAVLNTRQIISGAGLTGGGDLSADRTLVVGAGTGITVNADDVALTIPVVVSSGGTGAITLTGLLQGNGTSPFSVIANSSTVGQVLRVTGAAAYGWGALDLADTDAVTGVLPAASIGAAAPPTSIQYNNGGVLGGDANLTWTAATGVAAIGSTQGADIRASYGGPSISDIAGLDVQALNTGVGNLTNIVGLRAGAFDTGAGSSTNAYGLVLLSNSGTIANSYGILINDQNSVGSVTSPNLFSAGTTSFNQFEGYLALGDAYDTRTTLWPLATRGKGTSGSSAMNVRYELAATREWPHVGTDTLFGGDSISYPILVLSSALKTTGDTNIVGGINTIVIAECTGTGQIRAVQAQHLTARCLGTGTFPVGLQAFTIEADNDTTSPGGIGYLSACEVYANNNAAGGTVNTGLVYALVAQAFQAASAAVVANMHGVVAANSINGPVTRSIVVDLDFRTNATGVVTDSYLLRAETPVSAGTVTNHYAIYIEDQSAIGGTISRNITSLGASSTNLFEGAVIVGASGVNTGELRFAGTTGGVVTVKSLASFTSYTLTLPPDDGTPSQFLQTDGSGVLVWATASGSGTPGGADTQVQFNDSGAFGGDGGLTYNKTTDTLKVDGLIQFSGTASTFPALKRDGPTLAVRAADDSAYANIKAQDLQANTTGGIYWLNSTSLYAPSDGSLTLYNWAATDFGLIQFGGTTSSFPALKRSTTTLQARLADDSAFAAMKMSELDVVNFITISGGASTSGIYILADDPTIALGAAQDIRLTRDAADVFAQRRLTNAQTFRVYNTYTSATNYERGIFDWNDNTGGYGAGTILTYGTQKGSGGGSARPFRWVYDGSTVLDYSVSNPGGWLFQGNVGLGASNILFWNGRTTIQSTVDGDIRIGNATGSISVQLSVDDVAHVLAVRRGSDPQTLRIYNTYTNSTNYERGTFGWSSNVLTIGTEAQTGTRRGVTFVGNGRFLYTGESIGGTSSGTGFTFALGYNTANNKQAWYGDPDYLGNASANFVRFITQTGISSIDCINGDNSAPQTLQFCTSGANAFFWGPITAEGKLYLTSNFDTVLQRSAAGVVEINNGSTGTFRDLKLRNLIFAGTTSGTLTHIAAATTTSYTLTWPSAVAGGASYTLNSDTSGNLSWVAPGAASMAIGSAVTSGTAGRVLFVGAGPVLADDAGLTYDSTGNALTITGGTVTASTPLFNVTQTWNNAGVVFEGVNITVTDTASTKPSNFLKMTDSSNGSGVIFGKYSATVPGIWMLRTGETQSISNYNFLNDVGSDGMILNHANQFQFWIADTTNIAAVGNDATAGTFGLRMHNAHFIGWSSAAPYSTDADVKLWRDAINILAQRNGASAQTFRVYNTYTNSTNYERATFGWVSNQLVIGTERQTSTTDLPLKFISNGTTVGDYGITFAGVWSLKSTIYVVPNGGGNNWFVGQAGNLTVSGLGNFGMGGNALLSLTSGHTNVGIGVNALTANLSGFANLAIGSNVMAASTTSSGCVAIGSNCLSAATNVQGAIAIGFEAGTAISGASSFSIAIGYQCGQTDTGTTNVSIGAYAGQSMAAGFGNVNLGYAAGFSIAGGSENIVIGQDYDFGSRITTGSQNIQIGSRNQVASATASGQLCIGNFIYGTGLTGAGTTISTGKIGIGIKAPATELDVAGSITVGTALLPDANDGAAIGTTALQFSDLFLAEGAVINFDNGDFTLTQTGNLLVAAGGKFESVAVPTVSALTDTATPALDAALGNVFTLSATGNRTIAVPTNATNGQKIIIRHTSDATPRTLALNTGAGGFRFGTDITALTATAASKTDYIGCVYNSTASFWDVVAYAKGF